jgi:hypothetical protein
MGRRQDRCVTELTDPALIRWMDEHRRHALGLVHQMMGAVYELRDHDQRSLEVMVAERVALGHAAAEVATHLASVDLGGTALWLGYLQLGMGGTDEVDQWRQHYTEHGADAVRALVLPYLEGIAADLAHPHQPEGRPAEYDGVGGLPDKLRHVAELLGQARDAVARLEGHPHEAAELAATQQAWATFSEAARQVSDNLGQLHRDPYAKTRTGVPVAVATVNAAFFDLVRVLDAPQTQQAVAHGTVRVLHETVHHLYVYVNRAVEIYPY